VRQQYKSILLGIVAALLMSTAVFGQVSETILPGKVSYKSEKNVYVRFSSTALISQGDTLWFVKNGIYSPCLVVSAKSSISCITTPINDCAIALNSELVFRSRIIPKKEEVKVESKPKTTKDTLIKVAPKLKTDTSKNEITAKKYPLQNINGRITTAYYGAFSNIDNSSRQSLTGRVSLNVDHIKNSSWSFETYLNYRQNILDVPVPEGYQTKFFRVYNLAMSYDAGKNVKLSIGRKINNRIASVGAIDGVQTEVKMGHFFAGGIAGFRPDIMDYGLNTNLLQVGLYGGHTITSKKTMFETSLGIMEQRNASATDRRYLYLQHSNRLTERMNMFTSVELDLFEKVNGTSGTNPRLTSMYYSVNYQLSRKLSLMVSYDSRRNIIYYETFVGNEIDRLLAEDLSRQGLRARINYKLTKKIFTGISYSNRFQSDGLNKSDNYYGFITYSRLPWIKGSLNINANFNSSNYLSSKILATRYNRDIFKQKVNFSLYYRIIDYGYVTREVKNAMQHYIGSDFSFRIGKKYQFGIMGEMAIRGAENNYRLNFSATRRIRK
jgi:hypothetical protein